MERPASGSRTIKSRLAAKGHTVARCRVARLMRLQNLRAIYPKKRRTSLPDKGHKIYPYLLKTMTIDRPGQAYAADITYISMERGAIYLTAVIDWYSRKALAHRVSNTMDARFCVEALKEAIDRYGAPSVAVHVGGVYGRAQGARGAHLYGREGAVDRQRVRGALLAQPQGGRDQSACVRHASGGARAHRRLHPLLQKKISVPGVDNVR